MRVTTGIRMISWQCETVKTKLGHSDIENSNKEREKKEIYLSYKLNQSAPLN